MDPYETRRMLEAVTTAWYVAFRHFLVFSILFSRRSVLHVHYFPADSTHIQPRLTLLSSPILFGVVTFK